MGMNDWRPIETAPSEGVDVLITDGHLMMVARRYFKQWSITQGDYDVCANIEPTHWVPLPNPPEPEPSIGYLQHTLANPPIEDRSEHRPETLEEIVERIDRGGRALAEFMDERINPDPQEDLVRLR